MSATVDALAPGDPASVSALAADLSRVAQSLQDRRSTLRTALEHLADWRGPAADAARSVVLAQLEVLHVAAASIEDSVRALQEYVVDLQHAQALATQAVDYCHRHGLLVEADLQVRVPWGPAHVEDAMSFAERVPEGQVLVDRAHEEAVDAARRLAARVDGPVQRLEHDALRLAPLAADVESWSRG
ncbi:putative T7SS-secreted protein [Thalassiella azotivora]